MSDMQVQPAGTPAPPQGGGLTQWQRVVYTFSAPSKTFNDIRDRSKSWWVPLIIVIVTGGFLYGAISKQVTWKTVYENQQRAMPEFAKRMIENMPPEQRAAQEKAGPINQAVTWALSPIGLLLINMACAVVLWPTINFGFGGKATFGSALAVTMWATLVLWPVKLLLGGIALFVGAPAEAFDLQNIVGTNIGYYMEAHTGALYYLARVIDPIVIWNLVVTSIGLATVAGVKRTSGYIAVFGWWAVVVVVSIGIAAAF